LRINHSPCVDAAIRAVSRFGTRRWPTKHE
jgi:hypothetical protein